MAATKPSRWTVDPAGMRARVEKNTNAKRGGQLAAAPSEARIEAAMERARTKEAQQRTRALQTVATLQVELETNYEYQRYKQAHELWESTGVQRLWHDYKVA